MLMNYSTASGGRLG